MKQLCISEISEGKYDSLITLMITQDFDNKSIIRKVMNLSRGLENPAMVEKRIISIRDKA